jgi:hypothetical protein
MAYDNRQPCRVRQSLQLQFPDAQAVAVAAAAVGRDQQLRDAGIQAAAFVTPPAFDRGDRERPRVVIGPRQLRKE